MPIAIKIPESSGDEWRRQVAVEQAVRYSTREKGRHFSSWFPDARIKEQLRFASPACTRASLPKQGRLRNVNTSSIFDKPETTEHKDESGWENAV